MTITIAPLLESDVPEFVRVELAAFKSHPRIPMLWPRGYTDDLYAYMEAGKRDSLNDPEVRLRSRCSEAMGERTS